MRYANVPVAAIRGLALGGGCELAVHCAGAWGDGKLHGPGRVGGPLPGGGGLTYIAADAAEMAAAGNGPMPTS